MQAPTETEKQSPEPRWLKPAICFGLAIITLAVFGGTLRNGFVNYDDDYYIYENPVVARGLTPQGVGWAFSRAHMFNWHPVTWLSHMTDCQIYGLNPWGHHLTNVLLHAATVVLLFLVLRAMTGFTWRSAFVAAVFAIHPLRVESVAWVAERKDVLSGLFFVLTIWAYARYARDPAARWRYGLVAALFALGLMSKPMLVTLPLVLLWLDFWPLRRPELPAQLLREKLPLLAISLLSCAITVLSQQRVIYTSGRFSPFARVENAVLSYAVYLKQMVWPAGLAPLYPFPWHGPSLLETAAAVVLLTGISWVVWEQRRARPWLLTGWCWYLLMLLPVLGIIQVGLQAHADRYTYLPQIGIYIALTWLMAEWRPARNVLGPLAAGAVAVLMFCAWKQTAYWHDSQTLWLRTLACTGGNDIAHYNLGVVFDGQGHLDEAYSQYKQALEINPDYAEALSSVGGKLLREGKADEAMADCQRAIKLKPELLAAHYNLGNAYVKTGRLDEAIAQYRTVLQLNPMTPQVQNNLGILLRRTGKIDEAIAHYEQAAALLPNNEGLHAGLADVYLDKGREDMAVAQFKEALRINPVNSKIQDELAFLLATSPNPSLRDGPKAVELARSANERTGAREPVILGTLAAALAEAGQFAEARSAAQQAIDLARSAGEDAQVERLNDQLQFYEANRPFHRP